MKATSRIIADAMERHATEFFREDWDNTGLLLGSYHKEVSKVIVALDVTDAVVAEALDTGADMIVSHHPVIFKGERAITDGSARGRRLLSLIKNDIAVYASHTNLDIAFGGTNDVLFKALRLLNSRKLCPPKEGCTFGLGRVGDMAERFALRDFAEMVKDALGADCVTYAGDGDVPVRCVGLCGGAGAQTEMFECAVRCGCDVYVTGDVSHHKALEALDMGLFVVDASHYYTEAPVRGDLCAYLNNFFKEYNYRTDCFVSRAEESPFCMV